MDIVGSYRKMILSLVPENLKTQLAKEKGTLGEGVKYYLLAALVVDIVLLISMLLQLSLSGVGGAYQSEYGAAAAGVSLVTMIVMLVIVPVLMIVGSLITTGLGYIVCRILGGTGTFENQYYHFAIVGGGVAVISMIFAFIPCLGPLVNVVLSLYFLYPTFLIYGGVHKLSNGKAAFVTLLPLIFAVILLLIAFIIFGSMMAAILGSMPTPTGY